MTRHVFRSYPGVSGRSDYMSTFSSKRAEEYKFTYQYSGGRPRDSAIKLLHHLLSSHYRLPPLCSPNTDMQLLGNISILRHCHMYPSHPHFSFSFNRSLHFFPYLYFFSSLSSCPFLPFSSEASTAHLGEEEFVIQKMHDKTLPKGP